MKLYLTICFIFIGALLFAQEANRLIKDGNEAYKKGEYKSASDSYKKALAKEGGNITAKFNLGNALEKQNNIFEARKYYTEVSDAATEASLKSKAFYNKALALVREHQLPDAIEAFKQSLKWEPNDNDARENLQKAMNDLKKQQEAAMPKTPKEQKKPPQNKKNKQPDKEMMQQKFDELRDKEKQLQKMLQKKSTTLQPEKDW